MKVVRAKQRKEASAVGAAAMVAVGPVFWVIGGAVGGAIGAAIWAGIAYFTGYEVGWIAWGVGALAGVGTMAGARESAGFMSGIVASAIALASLLAGKFVAGSMVLDDLGLSDMPASEWYPELFSPYDILWVVLAVASAFKIGSAGGDDD
jgi:hypothetical protein